MSVSDESGVRFAGRFVLGDLLGVGGSAAVYEARDTAVLDDDGRPRPVALKVLHPHLSADPALREAFLAEVRAAQQVAHPNVAAVFEAGVDDADGAPSAWLAMELAGGGSLADRIATRGPMGPVEAADVLDGVLAALGAAHGVGLVHRDVSAANVLLTRSDDGPVSPDDVRLVDFGLADVTGRAAVGSDMLGAGHRGAGALSPSPVGVIGSAAYMSPEQALGLPVGAAGDLYQAGVLLYVLLTGQPPFPRPTAAQVLAAHVSAPPPVPSALNPAARPLNAVVTRAMAKSPERRYGDAAEFRAALGHAVAGLRSAVDSEDSAGTTRLLEPGAASSLEYLAPAGSAAEPGPTVPSSSGGLVAVLCIAVVAGVAAFGAISAAARPGPVELPTATVTPTVTAPAPTAPAPGPATPAPEPTSTGTAAAPESAEPTDPSTSAAPVLLVVPALTGSLADARAALEAGGLVLGTVTRVPSASVPDRVLGQQPSAGAQLEAGSPVDVTVASGTNAVPAVAGLSVPTAVAVLQQAGFAVADDVAKLPVGSVVTDTRPAAGTTQTVGFAVSLLLGPAPTPTPTGTPAPTGSPAGVP